MNFEGILNQIFQPYFYYSVLFLVISFVCVKVLARFCHFMGRRTKSILYLVPLAIPLIVMLVFMPSTIIQINNPGFGTYLPPPPPPPSPMVISHVLIATTLSVTGIICIIGLATGAFFAISMILADDRIARKILRVILLSPDEHQWLQTTIAELSKKLAITPPRVGLVEDLRPNAFTIGYGRRATSVFSIGLLNVLDKEEVSSVACHELAHVKNHDFFYKTLSFALTAISFFNPLAYIAYSTAHREREMFADERAIELLEKPTALGNALAKICKAIQTLPRESMLVTASSNLLVTSSVLHRLGILATHPRLDKRLRNISESKSSSRLNPRNVFLTFLLSLVLVSLAIAVSYGMVGLQSDFTTAQSPKLTLGFMMTGNRNLIGGGAVLASNSTAVSFSSQSVTVPISPPDNGYIISQAGNEASLGAMEPQTGRFVVVAPPDPLIGIVVNASDAAYSLPYP